MKANRLLLHSGFLVLCAILVMGCSTVSVNVPVMRPAEISLPGVNTVAIGPMSRSTIKLTGVSGNPYIDHSQDLREELTQAIAHNGHYSVVDRNRMDHLFRELNLILSNHFDSKEIVKLGQMAGADAFIYCRFKRNEYTESIQHEILTGKDKKEHTEYTREGVALVEVYFEIIDVATSYNPAPKTITKTLRITETATDAQPRDIDYERLLQQCREEVVKQYVKAIAPHKVYERVDFRSADHPQIDVGINRIRCSDWQGALAAFGLASESPMDDNPDQKGYALWNMGLTYCCMGDFDKALDHLNKAMDYLPNESASIARDISWTRRRQEEYRRVMEQQRSRSDVVA